MPKEEKVEQRLSEVEQLKRDVSVLQEALKEKTGRPQPKKPMKRTAKVMFVEDNPVVVIGQARDVGGEISIRLDVLKDEAGTTEPVEMSYSNMMTRCPRMLVEIVKSEKTEEATHQGPVPMEHTAGVGSLANGVGLDGKPVVPQSFLLEHTKVNTRTTIKFLEGPWEGKTIEMDAAYLNP